MRLLTLLLFPLFLHAQPGRFGLPACSGPHLELAARHGFFVCYDFARKLPRWTAHQILPGPPPPHRPRFRPDPALARPTAANRDFSRSGYHRGHLVPAADLAGDPAAYADSFLLSNVMPQPPAVNNGIWRRLENATRRLARHTDAVIVITGTLVAPGAGERLLPGQVLVPTHAFKAILTVSGAGKRMYAVIVSQNPQACAAATATTVDDLEHAAGLDFFAALDDAEEQALESTISPLSPALRGTCRDR